VKEKINIAIDGWSACGKGTLAKGLAEKLGYLCIDTGAMYRAFTLAAINAKIKSDDMKGIEALIENTKIGFNPQPKSADFIITLNGQEVEHLIRDSSINQNVSSFSALSSVRSFLVAQQQEIAHNKGVVMDGRDIGTVVLPHAELKIFMTASPEIRALRRFNELKGKNEQLSLKEISDNLQYRDYVDSTREDSPLRQAEDAIVLDNSHLSKEAQLEKAYNWAIEILNKKTVAN